MTARPQQVRLAFCKAQPSRCYPADADKRTVATAMIELATLDLVPCAARVTARTRVVSGEKDRPYLADGRELAAKIPDARLQLSARK